MKTENREDSLCKIVPLPNEKNAIFWYHDYRVKVTKVIFKTKELLLNNHQFPHIFRRRQVSQQGIVFNIQRFTIHDGPGVRTELFLKGCPLRCRWCSNPESWKPYIEPGIYKTKCISLKKCGMCQDNCPDKTMLQFYRGKLTSIDRTKCTNCMACYDDCPSDAIKQWGKVMTVEECMKEIRRDMGYYERSGGGVTVSGGEPLMQSDFAAELFKACKEEGIQTCLESTFYANWKEIEKVLPYTDIIISDIKHMDRDIHKQYTGVYNDKILRIRSRLWLRTLQAIQTPR